MKVAVITGAANGIGLALTTAYLQQNVTVVMVDKNENKLNEEALTLQTRFSQQVIPMVCDVTQAQAVIHLAQQVQEQVGRIDWIYNNAGIIGELAPIWELNLEKLHQVIDVNICGMVYVIQAFMPFLCEQNFHAHIINMASLYALCSSSQTGAYAMSKHAVLALSESLYFDLQRLNKPIDVSVVFPSFTDTGLLGQNPDNNSFHSFLQSLLSHSRPALEIAQHIVEEVEQKHFYIFPDKEVKSYAQERTEAMILQKEPHRTSIEKLMSSLLKRNKSN